MPPDPQDDHIAMHPRQRMATVYSNDELPLPYRDTPGAAREPRAQEALVKVGMAPHLNHYPSHRSGGQQQRVAVARVLGGRSSILLADEPPGNFDSKNREAGIVLLRDLHREGAIICTVTHDTRFARHAERTVYLFDGRMVQEELVRTV